MQWIDDQPGLDVRRLQLACLVTRDEMGLYMTDKYSPQIETYVRAQETMRLTEGYWFN